MTGESRLQLSRVERWILANHYRILEILDPSEKEYYGRCREILGKGFELEYDSICGVYYDDQTLSAEQCKEVLDILDMFRALKTAYETIPEWTGAVDAEFPGFDGNNETAQLSYTRHLANTDRFDELHTGDVRNSHRPMLADYRQMIKVWKASAEPHSLNTSEVRRILSAKSTAPSAPETAPPEAFNKWDWDEDGP